MRASIFPYCSIARPRKPWLTARARNRDGRADSPFTTMVLELEQQMLKAQAHKAKLILSKAGEIMTYEQYTRLMAQA